MERWSNMPKKLIFLFAGIVILAGVTALTLKLLGVWPFSSPTNATVQTLDEVENKNQNVGEHKDINMGEQENQNVEKTTTW